MNNDKLNALSPQEAKKLVEEGQAVIIDIRPPDQVAQHRIPGAMNIPLEVLENAKLPEDKALIFSCRAGIKTDNNQPLFKKVGQKNPSLHTMTGGILGWEAEGLTTEKG